VTALCRPDGNPLKRLQVNAFYSTAHDLSRGLLNNTQNKNRFNGLTKQTVNLK